MTDPDFASIPIGGRLLFLYSLMMADDAGNLEQNPRGMKMTLFPGDSSMTVNQVAKLTEALIAGGFYRHYEVAGRAYLNILGFKDSQRPQHPTAARCPMFPGQKHKYQVKQGTSWVEKESFGETQERTELNPRTDTVEPKNGISVVESSVGESRGEGEETSCLSTKTKSVERHDGAKTAPSVLTDEPSSESIPATDELTEPTPAPEEFDIEAAITASLSGGGASPVPAA